jgi:hypothetical protein
MSLHLIPTGVPVGDGVDISEDDVGFGDIVMSISIGLTLMP